MSSKTRITGKKYRYEAKNIPAAAMTGHTHTGPLFVAYERDLEMRPGGPARWALASEVVIHIEAIKKGYSFKRFDSLKDALGLNSEKLAKLANMSLATIHRRKAGGHLSPDESEKIYRLEKLVTIAQEVMNDDGDSVRSWFNTPQTVFGGEKPLDYAETLPGCEEIERVLRRMEQGIIL